MAEERNKHLKDVDDVKKKNEKLTSIINQMQQQGRGIPAGMQSTMESCYPEGGEADEGELEGDEDSECEYDEDAEEQISEGEFDDDDTEEEVPSAPGTYGPERAACHERSSLGSRWTRMAGGRDSSYDYQLAPPGRGVEGSSLGSYRI